MAINPLTLAEMLRPWRAAGISELLAEAPARETPSAAQRSEGLSSASEFAPEPEQAPAHAGKGLETSPEPTRPVKAPARAQTQKNSAPPAPRNYPEAWRPLLERTSPAPILWSYAELGEDLAGRGDKERSACLRRLIGSLQLPKGSSAFWPVYPPGGGESAPPPIGEGESTPGKADDFFQTGLRHLAPKVVIMLGTSTVELSGLRLSLNVPFTQQIHGGILYVLLPDFSAILVKPPLEERAGVFLRTALSGLLLT